MSVPSSFLTLSIKEQLWITILMLTIFSFLVILVLPGSFSYEILMEDYKRKKKFFYNEYMEYIHACFYFHNFNILKYEELVKRMAKQIYKYSTRESIYENYSDFGDNNTVEELFLKESNEKEKLYYYCYNDDNRICELGKNKLISKYESLNGLIFSHDMDNRFKDPGFSFSLIDSFFGININDSVIYGFNKNGLFSAIPNFIDKNSINKAQLNMYYQKFIDKQMRYASNNTLSSVNLDLFLFNRLFSKVLTELRNLEEIEYFSILPPEQYEKALFLYSRASLGYYSIIELSNDKCYLINYSKEQNKYYYFQFNLIKNFLDLIGNLLSIEQNMAFIPLYPRNNTIISPELCTKFLMRQTNEMINMNNLKESYNKIKKGVDRIEACFYDKKIFENKIIKEMIETNITHFLIAKNKFYQGLIELDQPYLFMKAPFPNLNILKEYQSDYLLIDQIDFYLFAPFKEPIEFAKYIKSQYQNLFFLIVILILYIWIICFIVNMIIYCKVAKQITEPIYKLQEAIENNNLKDENIFKYEYDDIINELFVTCKELLTGQIDTSNSLKFAGQFNILNKQKENDKIIDKNKYEKNLIINNEIVNELINEEQNMMNFKGEIDINDDFSINQDSMDLEIEERENFHRKTNKKKSRISNKGLSNESKLNKENIKINKDKEEEDKDKRSYKSMFRLAQYLYYYRCKVEENNIVININSNNDDKKSIISKINKNNQNQNSIKNNIKHKKSLSKSGTYDKNEDNLTINVLRGKDMTYLWYMEMKKKNNKSFNYTLSDDLEELFND